MHLGPLLCWAGKTLAVLDQQPASVLQHCTAERSAGHVRSAAGEILQSELVAFVSRQSVLVPEGSRFPGSTEVLESSFGKFKSLEGDQQKGGFTSLVLSYAALLGETTTEIIEMAITSTPGKRVQSWCLEHLGGTVQGKRVIAHRSITAESAQQSPEEPKSPSTPNLQLARQGDRLGTFRVLPDGERLLCSNWQFGLSLWSRSSGKLLNEIGPPGDAVGDDPQVRLFDLESGKQLHAFSTTNPAAGAAFHPDGRRAAFAGQPTVALFDLETEKIEWETNVGAGGWNAVAFSADGRFLAVANVHESTDKRMLCLLTERAGD